MVVCMLGSFFNFLIIVKLLKIQYYLFLISHFKSIWNAKCAFHLFKNNSCMQELKNKVGVVSGHILLFFRYDNANA